MDFINRIMKVEKLLVANLWGKIMSKEAPHSVRTRTPSGANEVSSFPQTPQPISGRGRVFASLATVFSAALRSLLSLGS